MAGQKLPDEAQIRIVNAVMARYNTDVTDEQMAAYEAREARLAAGDTPILARFAELREMDRDELCNLVLRLERHTQNWIDWMIWRGVGRHFDAPEKVVGERSYKAPAKA